MMILRLSYDDKCMSWLIYQQKYVFKFNSTHLDGTRAFGGIARLDWLDSLDIYIYKFIRIYIQTTVCIDISMNCKLM